MENIFFRWHCIWKTFSSAIAYTSRPYSESLATRRAVLYIPYATSSHEQTGNIITFSQFEEGCFLGNGHTLVKEESILDSIDELSEDDNFDD